ncbi:PadR family transcriptional regulator [Granulicoccus phenolivorans]|uniref:PadR family transcriptional regulator n=1 Tax=Granulicoccus phenolivorans TaxID=266854 RepID=UPI000424BC62|nr:PadR family transcriptional regulator [Granulicoccus phenolivorans]
MELKHAILGLLSVQQMSGYDLGRAFANSITHLWHADQSQIYRTLTRLGDTGAIETTVINQDGKPDRKVHALTEVGRAELDAWLRSPLEQEQSKEPFLARLFFAAPLGVPAVLDLLAEREAQARALLDTLRAIDAPTGDLAATLRAATLRSGIGQAEAELRWLEQTRRTLTETEAPPC